MKYVEPIAATSRNMVSNHNHVFGVLWDMDGVLVDTGEFHYQSWSVALAEVNIPYDREKFRKTFGMNNTRILTILLGHPPLPSFLTQVSDRKESLFRQMIRGKVHPMPGVIPCLEGWQSMNYPQAVASSAPMANIDALVDEMEIRSYFSALVSAFYLPSKPDPAVFLEAARQLDLPPNKCIVIEDSLPGINAAHRAGMKCIAVASTNPRQKLSIADLIVNSLEDLRIDNFKI